uniref:Uncharacterized protein n=1 Tax=Anguilla anguilla TaxID=7936 RepID=A0A0E9S2T8_ANGAN
MQEAFYPLSQTRFVTSKHPALTEKVKGFSINP